MLILIALLQEPSPICPRCRLFIQKICSTGEYPHSIFPLDFVLVLFCVFPLSPTGFRNASLVTRAQQKRMQSAHSGLPERRQCACALTGRVARNWGAAFKRLNTCQQRHRRGDRTRTSKVTTFSQWNNVHIIFTLKWKSNKRFLGKNGLYLPHCHCQG